MKEYYSDEAVTIYHGDCREVLPHLGPVESIITDPVWPNAAVDMAGRDDPYGLFAGMCASVVDAERVVVQLGCDSDPRFLSAIPERWPFLRVCWLDYARPSYKGRLLYTGDVAYVFGTPPAFIAGRQVMSGMCRSATNSDPSSVRHTYRYGSCGTQRGADAEIALLAHPCARRFGHVAWLVGQFSDHMVCDPFAGSGTTLLAAKKGGRRAIGIEIEERYCEIAANRCRQSVLPLHNGDNESIASNKGAWYNTTMQGGNRHE